MKSRHRPNRQSCIFLTPDPIICRDRKWDEDMHGLINRSIQYFVSDTYGRAAWEDATMMARNRL